MPGSPEKLSCWPQALPETDSLEPTGYWANGVSGKALLPALQSAGTRSAANDPSPGWGFKFPWLRALQNQHLQSRPSCRRASKSHPNSLPGWHSGTIPTAHPARAVPLTPIPAQHLCPGALSKAPQTIPQSPGGTSQEKATAPVCCCKAQSLQLPSAAPGSAAAPTEVCQPQAWAPAPAAACWEHGDQKDCGARFSSTQPREKQGSDIFSGTS